MTELGDVKKIGADELMALAEKAKAGDPAAMRRYMLFGVWKKLQTDRLFPARFKTTVFDAIASRVRIVSVEKIKAPTYAR